MFQSFPSIFCSKKTRSAYLGGLCGGFIIGGFTVVFWIDYLRKCFKSDFFLNPENAAKYNFTAVGERCLILAVNCLDRAAIDGKANDYAQLQIDKNHIVEQAWSYFFLSGILAGLLIAGINAAIRYRSQKNGENIHLLINSQEDKEGKEYKQSGNALIPMETDVGLSVR